MGLLFSSAYAYIYLYIYSCHLGVYALTDAYMDTINSDSDVAYINIHVYLLNLL